MSELLDNIRKQPDVLATIVNYLNGEGRAELERATALLQRLIMSAKSRFSPICLCSISATWKHRGVKLGVVFPYSSLILLGAIFMLATPKGAG